MIMICDDIWGLHRLSTASCPLHPGSDAWQLISWLQEASQIDANLLAASFSNKRILGVLVVPEIMRLTCK